MYRSIYQLSEDILRARGATHIKINSKLIVRRDYLLDFQASLRVAQFYDGTSDVVDEDCVTDVENELARRKTVWPKKKK